MAYQTENGGSDDKVPPSSLRMSPLRRVREGSGSPGRRTRESE